MVQRCPFRLVGQAGPAAVPVVQAPVAIRPVRVVLEAARVAPAVPVAVVRADPALVAPAVPGAAVVVVPVVRAAVVVVPAVPGAAVVVGPVVRAAVSIVALAWVVRPLQVVLPEAKVAQIRSVVSPASDPVVAVATWKNSRRRC